jgi:hypothetical protein
MKNENKFVFLKRGEKIPPGIYIGIDERFILKRISEEFFLKI